MYVFGGWDGNVTLDDLIAYDFETNSWFFINDVKG